MELWVIAGGCALTLLSAMANAGFLITLGTSVSHLTGDVTRVAVELTQDTHHVTKLARHLLLAMSGFLLGAMTAGFAIHHPNLEISRPYGRAVMAIGACLLLAHFFLTDHPLVAIALTSFGCGFQNALATHYRGMILRTTHITGLLTDLGTNLGMRLRGHAIAPWKILVPLLLVGSFFLGSGMGALLVMQGSWSFLAVTACLYMTGGLGWTVYKHLIRGIQR
jgi:uncharacterized membrane protein YoaK (UPF0700 family)